MKVESIAECSTWSILQYFWPALSDNGSWKPIFGLFESGHFTQALVYSFFVMTCHIWSWGFLEHTEEYTVVFLPLQMEIMTEDYYRQVEEVSKTQEKLTKCEEQLTLAEVKFV